MNNSLAFYFGYNLLTKKARITTVKTWMVVAAMYILYFCHVRAPPRVRTDGYLHILATMHISDWAYKPSEEKFPDTGIRSLALSRICIVPMFRGRAKHLAAK